MLKKLFYTSMLILTFAIGTANAQETGYSLGTTNAGLAFGNFTDYMGVKFNIVDRNIESFRGLNITFGRPEYSRGADIRGVSIGLWGTDADQFTGININGVGATGSLYRGLSIDILGIKNPDSRVGVNLGLLSIAAREEMRGLNLALFAAGSGDEITGVTIGGFAAGSGGDMRGITIGGFAAGAGRDTWGLTIGGFAAGAGNDMTGIVIGGFATGAGNNLTGLVSSIFASGAGNNLTGIAVTGFAAGAGNEFTGLGIAGITVGAGGDMTGLFLSAGTVLLKNEGGYAELTGAAISMFNKIDGNLHGVSIGIINIADSVDGIQLGLLNFVRNNRRGMRLLPIFNRNFR